MFSPDICWIEHESFRLFCPDFADELVWREGAAFAVEPVRFLGVSARGGRMLLLVHLPSALPYILTGLKISLSAGIATLVAAELAGAIFGVGYLIQVSQQVFRVDLMFVGLIALGVGNWALISALDAIIRYLAPWYGAENRPSFGRVYRPAIFRGADSGEASLDRLQIHLSSSP